MVKNAEVPSNPKTKRVYCFRTVRALRATQYIKVCMEYKTMKWEPFPPNPLMHESTKMTIDKYAAKGCENIYEARKRCI